MTTKQTTQLCYQVNGGYCRNKVSAKNYYVCAAGHARRRKSLAQYSPQTISRMSKQAQRELAKNPSIDRDIQQALFDTGDIGIQWELARNPGIDRDMAQALFDTGDEWIRRNLATNPSIDHDMAQALYDTGEDRIRRNLAKNPSIDHDMAQALFATRDKGIWSGLATNPSIDRDIAQALFDMEDWVIRCNLAWNPSIDREMAIKLAKDEYRPIGYLENKSITEICNGENISLINDYPKEFGRAYLDHLLELDENLEEMKALFCYSYNSYVKAGGEDYFTLYKRKILEKYPGDEEIKYLLS